MAKDIIDTSKKCNRCSSVIVKRKLNIRKQNKKFAHTIRTKVKKTLEAKGPEITFLNNSEEQSITSVACNKTVNRTTLRKEITCKKSIASSSLPLKEDKSSNKTISSVESNDNTSENNVTPIRVIKKDSEKNWLEFADLNTLKEDSIFSGENIRISKPKVISKEQVASNISIFLHLKKCKIQNITISPVEFTEISTDKVIKINIEKEGLKIISNEDSISSVSKPKVIDSKIKIVYKGSAPSIFLSLKEAKTSYSLYTTFSVESAGCSSCEDAFTSSCKNTVDVAVTSKSKKQNKEISHRAFSKIIEKKLNFTPQITNETEETLAGFDISKSSVQITIANNHLVNNPINKCKPENNEINIKKINLETPNRLLKLKDNDRSNDEICFLDKLNSGKIFINESPLKSETFTQVKESIPVPSEHMFKIPDKVPPKAKKKFTKSHTYLKPKPNESNINLLIKNNGSTKCSLCYVPRINKYNKYICHDLIACYSHRIFGKIPEQNVQKNLLNSKTKVLKNKMQVYSGKVSSHVLSKFFELQYPGLVQCRIILTKVTSNTNI